MSLGAKIGVAVLALMVIGQVVVDYYYPRPASADVYDDGLEDYCQKHSCPVAIATVARPS